MSGTDVRMGIDINGYAQGNLALSSTAAQTTVLEEGIYAVWVNEASDIFIKVGATANDVTASTGMVVKSGAVVPVRVPDNCRIGAVVASGTPTLRYHRIG